MSSSGKALKLQLLVNHMVVLWVLLLMDVQGHEYRFSEGSRATFKKRPGQSHLSTPRNELDSTCL